MFGRSGRGPIRALYNAFWGEVGLYFRLEMNEKGGPGGPDGLTVPGEAPFVYYFIFFGAGLGFISSGDE